ncbi:hypothetical protein [Arthrobacter sp. NPDC080082]
MSHEFTMTKDDARPANPSLAEDTLELSLLTAGEKIGPVDTEWAQEHHNF